MTNFFGPDKLVGMLLGTIGPTLLYWENVKSLDVQRLGNSLVLSIENEKQEYIGFGRESFKDAEVHATVFLMQNNPLGLVDEQTLEQFLDAAHTIINQYTNSSRPESVDLGMLFASTELTVANGTGVVTAEAFPKDTICENPVVWVKIIDEKRADTVRGVVLYEMTFQVRVYVPAAIGVQAGSATNVQLGLVAAGGSPSLASGTPMFAQTIQSGLMQLVLNFLAGLPAPSSPPNVGGVWTAVPFSAWKAIDLQRAGDTAVVHAPVVSGHVMGLGDGQIGNEYRQQQVSDYTFKITLYAFAETDIVTATDWIAAQSVQYFLNAPFGNGMVILGKLESFDSVLNERGVWLRELELMVKAIVGP